MVQVNHNQRNQKKDTKKESRSLAVNYKLVKNVKQNDNKKTTLFDN